MKVLFQPVKPFFVSQRFGQNGACVSTDGTKKVITCDGKNPPKGYKSLYGKLGHTGIDLPTKHGQPVYAAQDGVVYMIDTNEKSGLDVRIESDVQGEKYRHIYEHLLGYQVKVGDTVQAGQLIGWADNCFDKETEVLTENGWKFFSELSDERVATINMDTEQLEYQYPTKYTKRFERKMYLHQTKTTDFCVSIDHNILYRTAWLKKMKIDTLKNVLQKKDRRLVTSSGWSGADVETFYLPAHSFVRDRWGTKSETKPIEIKMDTWLAFLGIFLADGNLGQRERNRIVIAQSKPDVVADIHNLLDALPFKYWTGVRKQGNNDLVFFYISNNQLYDYLKATGKAENRCIPNFVRTLSRRQIQIFLDWFFKGDGHHRGYTDSAFGEKTYYPGLSKPIADMLQELIIKTGYGSNIKVRGKSY